MNRCIIHIGMHKTGSTSIQHSLKNFSDGQFLYAALGQNPNHSLALYSLFATNPAAHRLHASRRSTGALKGYLDENRKALERAISAARGRTLVVSGEGITGLKPDEVLKMAEFFRSKSDLVTVVGYVRPPAAFMSSGFQQRVQGGALSVFNLERIYRNYRATFAKFDAAFARENVLLWKFEPASFPNKDVVRDFCERLQIVLTPNRITRVNESLPRQVVALLYTYHKYCGSFGAQKMNEAATHKLANLLKRTGNDRFRLSPAVLRPILENNRNDIEWMENRLGESLDEQLDEQSPGDIRDERDLLRPDPIVAGKLLKLLGRSAPEDVEGRTPQEIAQLIHALRLQQKPARLLRWLKNVARISMPGKNRAKSSV